MKLPFLLLLVFLVHAEIEITNVLPVQLIFSVCDRYSIILSYFKGRRASRSNTPAMILWTQYLTMSY